MTQQMEQKAQGVLLPWAYREHWMRLRGRIPGCVGIFISDDLKAILKEHGEDSVEVAMREEAAAFFGAPVRRAGVRLMGDVEHDGGVTAIYYVHAEEADEPLMIPHIESLESGIITAKGVVLLEHPASNVIISGTLEELGQVVLLARLLVIQSGAPAAATKAQLANLVDRLCTVAAKPVKAG